MNSNEILLIGDVHGLWTDYAQLLEQHQPSASVQVGDFGIGFWGENPLILDQVRQVMDTAGSGNNRYIRGNHDNPASCRADPRCIKDATFDSQTGIFYLGGALSIDRHVRTEDINWWSDEELNTEQLYSAIDVYESAKPDIVISHECPEDVVGYLVPWYRVEYPSRTRQALGSMWSLHKPRKWLFGHWHSSISRMIDGCQFVCLDELETLTIEV